MLLSSTRKHTLVSCCTTGRAVGKPYLDKARSLSFNLNDPSNPDLRRAVLTVRLPHLVRVCAMYQNACAVRASAEKLLSHVLLCT